MVEGHLERHGVRLALKDGVAGFKQSDDGALEVETQSGKNYPADIVILALGVRPETTLAKAAGLEIGERGGIRVDEQMRTSDPDIFAVGDAVEVKDVVTGQWSLVALAGPANRQGRIAADVIAGRDVALPRHAGHLHHRAVRRGGGLDRRQREDAQAARRPRLREDLSLPNSHAGYYPGAKPFAMKLLFRNPTGRLLGAQALGEDGVDKRISALAMAIQMGATIYDLEEAELCYAPQFGSAKDPVNFAGMVAADVLRGDMPLSHWDTDGGLLLDVREPVGARRGDACQARSSWVSSRRAPRLSCPAARSSPVDLPLRPAPYYATRLLVQHGFKARNLSGACCHVRSSRRIFFFFFERHGFDFFSRDRQVTRSSAAPASAPTTRHAFIPGCNTGSRLFFFFFFFFLNLRRHAVTCENPRGELKGKWDILTRGGGLRLPGRRF